MAGDASFDEPDKSYGFVTVSTVGSGVDGVDGSSVRSGDVRNAPVNAPCAGSETLGLWFAAANSASVKTVKSARTSTEPPGGITMFFTSTCPVPLAPPVVDDASVAPGGSTSSGSFRCTNFGRSRLKATVAATVPGFVSVVS